MIPTREQAWDLLCEYNEGEFHRLHARIVGDVMRYFAAQLGYADEADFWQTVGILHDLDFEQYPDQHCTAISWPNVSSAAFSAAAASASRSGWAARRAAWTSSA